MSGPVNPVFYRFFVKADAFRATDACIGCGKCEARCPYELPIREKLKGVAKAFGA